MMPLAPNARSGEHRSNLCTIVDRRPVTMIGAVGLGAAYPTRHLLRVCAEQWSTMADPRAFLSFDFDHNLTSKNLFAGQAKTDSPTPFIIQDWSSKTELPQAQWEQLIKT